MNEILVIAAGLSFAGALVALWLVREHEIERGPDAGALEPIDPEPASSPAPLPEAAPEPEPVHA